jgi:hypothetical protein
VSVRVIAGVALLVLGMVCSTMAQGGADTNAAAKFFGTWSGSWEGNGTGGFELTLEKGKDGAPGGKVSVTGEPTYNATLKTLKVEGQKLTATYDFPPDDSLEVALTATFDGDTAKGTWSARGKNGGSELATGTWTVKKK